MRKSIFSSRIFVNTVVTLIIVIIAVLINISDINLNTAVKKSSLDELYQTGLNFEYIIERQIEDSINELSSIADYIVQNDVTSSNFSKVLEIIPQEAYAYSYHFIELTGEGTSLYNDVRDFSSDDNFLYSFENSITTIDSLLTNDASGIGFYIYFPIMSENNTIGILYNEVYFYGIFENASHGSSILDDKVIIDKDLNIISSTKSEHVLNSRFPDDILNVLEERDIENVSLDITHGISGGIYYDFNDESKVASYYPIENTNLTLILNAYIDTINPLLLDTTKYSKATGIITFWAIIILVFFATYSQWKSKKILFNTAYFDRLTGLPNSTKLREDVTNILKKNKNDLYSIIIFDIDNFKAINEMFGYDVGDKTLKAFLPFAKSFNEPTLILSRISGDRFVLFSGNGFLEDINNLIGPVESFFDKYVPELTGYPATYKIGRYTIEHGETDYDDIMSKVNLAHARARETKGEFICDYDEAFKKNLQMESLITKKMNLALENNDYKVYLQPKFSTHENKLVGAEALVRWIEPDGNMIFPNDFIPLFEKNGFIVDLDKYIIETVCTIIQNWINQGINPIPVSVNCSRINLINPYFVDDLVAIVDKYSVPHEYIEVELTESTTIEQDFAIEKLFADLRENKFKISIDDFGSGYSSLSMLKNLNVDTLKMDRSFFVGGKNERRDDMLIDSIVKMAHNLGMYVVAEGIETQKQADLLKSMNCDAIQGYLYARPMPIHEFEDKYRDTLLLNKYIGDNEKRVIRNINDIRFASMFATCGLLIIEANNSFTIIEANDYFFDVIGYTREDVRDLFNNEGIGLLDKNSRRLWSLYFKRQMRRDPFAPVEFSVRHTTKDGNVIRIKFNGKMIINENGLKRIYFSIIDISDYVKISEDLRDERAFISNIVTLTDSAFFDYDISKGNIRFSKNFADRYNIPESIDNFVESKVATEQFDAFSSKLKEINPNSGKVDGEFCVTLSDSNRIWHTFNCDTYYDKKKNSYKLLGSISKPLIHKLETDILRVKSEEDPLTVLYSKQATERYIRNYLRISTIENYSDNNNTGAFFLVNINNFVQLNSISDPNDSDKFLREVGLVLRNTFRSTDIVGRASEEKFYVFINNYNTIDFVKSKALELCNSLNRTYSIKGNEFVINTKIGISLYPEHGDDFDTVYKKADEVLQSILTDDSIQYKIHE